MPLLRLDAARRASAPEDAAPCIGRGDAAERRPPKSLLEPPLTADLHAGFMRT